MNGVSQSRSMAGFTLVELLAIMTIIAILATLLLPGMNRAKMSAKSAACRSNLRQLGLALNLYTGECDRYPPVEFRDPGSGKFIEDWNDMLRWVSGIDARRFHCPFTRLEPTAVSITYEYNAWGTGFSPVQYGWTAQGLGLGGFDYPYGPGQVTGSINGTPIRESVVRVPSDMIAFADFRFDLGFSGFGWPGVQYSNHQNRLSNAVFCDDHVESSDIVRIPKELYSQKVSGFTLTLDRFKPTEAQAKRWNNDNQPHSETWPKN